MDGVVVGKRYQIMIGKSIHLSLIIPVYNESDRLIEGLSQIYEYLKKQPFIWEIVLVDDGSKIPAEQTIVEAEKQGKLPKLNRKLQLRIIRLSKNQGKGKAIREGIFASRGQVFVFCDVDNSVPIETINFVLKKLKQFPVVITSRRHKDSKIIVHQAPLRELSGRIFTALSNGICNTHVSDVTCGMKGFSRESGFILFSKQKIFRWVFDTELLFLAHKYGLEVRQVPVGWSNKVGSKVRSADMIQSFVDLFKIRLNDLLGVYNKR
jgi:dolichyl-phosphate beta-glucosyltransferase